MNEPIKADELKGCSDRALYQLVCDAVERVIIRECLSEEIATQLQEFIEVKRRFVTGSVTDTQINGALEKIKVVAQAAYKATIIDERIEFTSNRRASEAIVQAVWSLLKAKASKRNPDKLVETVASVLDDALEAVIQSELMRLHPNRTMFVGQNDSESAKEAEGRMQLEISWQRLRLLEIKNKDSR